MLERILVPLDGSMTAEAILPHVRRLARRRDSEILLVRAVRAHGSKPRPPMTELSLGAAQQYVLGVRDRLEHQGFRASAEAVTGAPVGTILAVAVEREASLIAMATHGRSGLSRVLLGSIAERILRKSPVPVLAVRPFGGAGHGRSARTGTEPIRSILVPTDGSPGSTAVLWPAIELARAFDARLDFLLVLTPEKAGKGGKPRLLQARGRRRLEELSETAEREGLETRTVIEPGDPEESILRCSRSPGCGFIALVTHGRSGLPRLLTRSVTERVLRESAVPLLVVRARGNAKNVAVRAEGRMSR